MIIIVGTMETMKILETGVCRVVFIFFKYFRIDIIVLESKSVLNKQLRFLLL